MIRCSPSLTLFSAMAWIATWSWGSLSALSSSWRAACTFSSGSAGWSVSQGSFGVRNARDSAASAMSCAFLKLLQRGWAYLKTTNFDQLFCRGSQKYCSFARRLFHFSMESRSYFFASLENSVSILSILAVTSSVGCLADCYRSLHPSPSCRRSK